MSQQLPPILHGEYRDVEYLQFDPSPALKVSMAILGTLTWPILWPLAMLSRRSEIIFRSMSELLSLVPYFPGLIVRYEFYRFALRACGKNVLIELGTVFIHPDVELGSNVLIGRFNVVHHCDIGSFVLIGERCTFLSGSQQHRFDRADVPIARQGGRKKRIRLGDDSWIASHSVVMEDVGEGSVVGAGSVVTKPVPSYTIVAGSPARVLKRRGETGESVDPSQEAEPGDSPA